MKIWRPLTEFRKPRDEIGYHCDLALGEGEGFYLIFGPPANGIELKRICPRDEHWKIHFELAVEKFPGGLN